MIFWAIPLSLEKSETGPGHPLVFGLQLPIQDMPG